MNNYKILSEELKKAAVEVDKTDDQSLKEWFGLGVDADSLKNGTIDEEELLENLAVMFAMMEDLAAVPESLLELKNTLEKILPDRNEYLRYALAIQRIRLQTTLKTEKFEKIEKRQNGLKRAQEKVIAEMARLSSPQYAVHLSEMLLRKMVKRVSDGPIQSTRVITEKESRVKIVTFAPKVIDEEIKEEIGEVESRFAKDLAKMNQAYVELQVKMRIEEEQLALRLKMQALLDSTTVRLEALGGKPESETRKTTAGQPVAATEMQSKKRKKKFLPVEKKEEAVPEIVQQGVDLLAESDLKELDQLVAYAGKNSLKIRVLLPEDHQSRFEKAWTDLLRALGFKGRIESVEPKLISRTKDFETPLIVPKKMNGAQTMDRRKFPHLVVTQVSSPNQLMTFFQSKKERRAI